MRGLRQVAPSMKRIAATSKHKRSASLSKSARKQFEPGVAFLLCLHIAACCWSLAYATESYGDIFNFDKIHLPAALLNVAIFAVVAIPFTISRFSFGYFLGFYFYTMILGYLWLIEFSQLPYDHSLAKISIFLSGVAFLAPVLFITSPIRQRLVLSARALDWLLSLILILSAIAISVGASYNFRVTNLSDIYKFREGLEFPALLRYALGITANALLPFAFACFVARGNRWRGGIALLLNLLLYPVTLTKMTLFAPFWLLFLTLLSKTVTTRIAVILSLLLPISCGIVLVLLRKAGAVPVPLEVQYFGTVNSRMVAIPSIALEVYNIFFSTHDLTYFCQINVLKRFVDCPYDKPLSIVMSNTYQLGAFNASLFATEGIASVGLIFAPLSALVCGWIIALANRLSSGLPSNFILLSSGILIQIFLNVPLSTTLLSNGAACLFLLWYVMPRSMFETEATEPSLSAQP
jgi:hypothetical protein